MKLVSVIVPIYNVEEYLPRCIDSIINQTYKELEIILVNDGSVDGCDDICKAYAKKDNRIKYYYNENHGCSYSRNFGIEKSTGEYLLIIDSDDYIDTQLVEIAMNEINSYDSDILVFDMQVIDNINNRKNIISSCMPTDTDVSIQKYPIIINDSPTICNKVIKRSIWTDYSISFPVGKRYEDLDATSKLIGVAKKIRYYNAKPLYYYMIRQGSFVQSKFTEEKYTDIMDAVNSVENFYKKRSLYDFMSTEFEYYNILHTYFYPSKELIREKNFSDFLEKIRKNIDKKYPKFYKNKYLKTLSTTDKLLFKLLVKKRYKIMNIMSNIRNLLARFIGAIKSN